MPRGGGEDQGRGRGHGETCLGRRVSMARMGPKAQDSVKTRAWVKNYFDTRSPEKYDYALMSGALPPSLDLARAARQDYGLEGRLSVKKLPRLAAALASDDGEVEVELTAGRDEAKRVMV